METEAVDVVIVGAGMAGVASALWGHRLDLSFVLLEESERWGGQLHCIHNPIPDYPGLQTDGAGFVEQLQAQMDALGVAPLIDTAVDAVDWKRQIVRSGERAWRARALVIATGLRKRPLPAPGAERLLGKGLEMTFSGAREAFAGRRACVVGGGDGAFENALMMAEVCPQVSILYRGDQVRARESFQQEVAEHPNIEVCLCTDVLEVHGDERVAGLTVRTPEGQARWDTEAVLVKIGMEPQVEWLGDDGPEQSEGYLRVDREQRTTLSWVWAVGDVCSPRDPSLSVAAGQACVAMRAIERTLGSV